MPLAETLILGSNMSDGRRLPADEFGRAAAKVAVAQLCETAGFHGVKDSALEAFADIAIRYLVDLGKTAEFYANLAGRSQCNVFDVIRGLEDLESPRGFQMTEIVNFVKSTDEVPFAQPIPHFPVNREPRGIPSFSQMGETPPSKHIPAWLPALPDPHTYIHTPVWEERSSDPRDDKIEQARQRRKAERSLLSLQKRLLLCSSNNNNSSNNNGLVDAAASGNASDPALERVSERVEADKNPVNEKSDVSQTALPDGNRVSLLEVFAPAIEKLGGGGLLEDGVQEEDEGEGKMGLPVVRPTVHFKFKTGKKFIGESLDTRLQKKDASRNASLAGREDERDDKKRRAEYILKQSMENPQELTLL